MLVIDRPLTAQQPYPGLRSFETSEAILFHGRERHVDELLRRLSQTRFLAVIGGSGSGKSSLVRAGLLPGLYRGYLTGATTRWRVAVMRPGSSPLSEMAKALADPAALGSAEEPLIRESSYGLVNAFRAGSVPSGESLFLVVDQFEELFRFRRESRERDGGAEASLFVSQLLQAADEFGVPIYVVITMRSDFLGDCSQFPGLPEALNRGQYLIPRMTREQRRAAITAPLEFFDAAMSDRLVQRLLNDAGDDPDQLPVLQHALQQTYAGWVQAGSTGDIDFEHYEAAGTMQRALDEHAERVYASAGGSGWIVERIFRCLTVDENGRAVRRPARFWRILRVTGASGNPSTESETRRIIELFAAPENSFLVWGTRKALEPESVVDISHESLIRKWSRLQGWVRDEAKGVDIYRYLRRDASLYPNDAGLWNEPDLSSALKARESMGWNAAWAEQYSQSQGATYPQVQEFLEASVKDRDLRLRRERRLQWLKLGAAALLIVLAGVAVRLYHTEQERRASQAQRDRLQGLNSSLEAEKNLASARASELVKQIGALESRRAADAAELDAELQRLKGEADSSQSTARASELEKQIKDLQGRRAADQQRLIELERLRDEKDRTDKAVTEREQLINENRRQVEQPGQDSSEFLRRINELQGQLKQAWDERDAVRTESSQLKQALAQNKIVPAMVLRSNVPVMFPTESPVVAFVTPLYSGAAPLYVIPLTASRRECGPDSSLTQCLLNIIAEPGPSCPSGAPLYCFDVREPKANHELQQLGTVEIGPLAYALYSWGWRRQSGADTSAINIGLVPIRTAKAP